MITVNRLERAAATVYVTALGLVLLVAGGFAVWVALLYGVA